MRLISLSANKDTFKTVEFKKTGLNIIVACKKDTSNESKDKTYNGVGKSLMIEIIHFCLGATPQGNFLEKLVNWIFYLEFEIAGENYKVERAIDNYNKIFMNKEELSVDNFNKKMQKLCFEIPSGIQYLTFRTLIPFFIRRTKGAYSNFADPDGRKKGTEYQKLLNNAFLLGLDVGLIQTKKMLKKDLDNINNLTKQIKKDPVLKEFFIGSKDLGLAKKNLEEEIKELEHKLNETKVAEDYYQTEQEANQIKQQLDNINNQIATSSYQIKNIEQSLKNTPDLSKEKITSIYEEARIIFSNNLSKTLDELEVFNKQLLSNRAKRLAEQKLAIQNNLTAFNNDKKDWEKKLDQKLQYLNAHNAVDVVLKLNNKLSDKKNQKNDYLKYESLLKEYENKELNIKKQFVEEEQKTVDYLNSTEENSDKNMDGFFRRLAKKIYPDATSGITVKNNSGTNQLRYDFDAKIESDSSDGIGSAKIFCYDLTLLFMGSRHKIDFLFHDNRLFSDIDPRQKISMLSEANNLFNTHNKQYILTLNQNQIDDITEISDGEKQKLINDNIILKLTDNSDTEKLLGIKIDLKYD
ncbi:MAG: DUF2326 domain-containing protein [Alphaproteobacteria bacterium]